MLNFLFKSKPDYINFGLLFYRLALGISMFYHGYLKYVSGEQGLYKVGAMLSALGVPSGFEVILGIIIGLFTRIGCLLIIGTLAVATILNLNGNFFSWDYPSQMGFGAIMLFFAGAGRYSLDKALFK